MDKNIISELKSELAKTSSEEERKALWRKYFGKEGTIKKLMSGLGKLPPEKRRDEAIAIQNIQKEAIELLNKKEKELAGGKIDLKKEAETLGFSLPKVGHLHPLTQTIRMMNQFFIEMGYSIMEGPEVETDEYCFKRLNVPADHPARDMQDTIYIQEPDYLLRTQASSIESHILSENKPPFKVVGTGRVYRNEKVNKSNHFIFHHYQGVVVMEKISLKDLFGTFTRLFQKMYGPKVVIRYRNKYYPEVEPGVGPDMRCFNCHGKGCRICKNVGWIEMGGAGIIHPNVLKMAGIDPKKWMGFAFGLGLDRWAMAKYNITDIRTLLGGNLGYKYHENENTL
jgi:phenylalanyl-tRNA synthetase alpha chain